MSRALTVWWEGGEVGELALNEHGNMTFAYSKTWLEDPHSSGVSISLPKQEAAFSRAQTRPFFAGLLPEERPRAGAARALGVSPQNDFGLLEGLGGDVAGALTLWPRGEDVPRPDPDEEPRVLEEPALAHILEGLPRRPLLAGEQGIRLSLAGAQPKVPVVLVDGTVALPAAGQPTTHIIKPAPKEYPTFPQNEAFCMRLAAELGLPVAPVEIRQAGSQTYLLVERYDRVRLEDGSLARLHQEDFCQALGVMPEHKYAAEQGPNFQDSFALLRRATRLPAPAVLALVDAALFNLIIGNADAHGKNFSLLYTSDGLKLAPLYDLLCTSFYPEVQTKMAMRMGGAAKLEEFTPDTLGEFAAHADVAAPYVRRRCLDLARRTVPAMEKVAHGLAEEGFATAAIGEIIEHIRQRSEALLGVAEISGARLFAGLDKLIKADQFDVLATEIKAFRAKQPAISRYLAGRLGNRIFDTHPAFQQEKARLVFWRSAQPEWRETIERFATDAERLGETIQAALKSLRAFDLKEDDIG